MLTWLVQNPEQTNAMAAVTNAVVAALALGVAAFSIYFTARGLGLQREHNKMSVRPIPYISLAKRAGIKIVLENHGLGPFKVDLFEIVRSGIMLNNIVDIIPERPPLGIVVTFTTGMFDRTLPPSQTIEILSVSIENNSPKAVSYFNQVKLNLQDTVINIGYSDMYNQRFEQYHKDMDWLCRS